MELELDEYLKTYCSLDSSYRVPKENAKSLQFRQTGNEFFAKRTVPNFLIALKLYNKSICFAENGSEHMAMGYANRSAVYFELKLYDVCLKNIELVRSAGGYPDRLIEKLNKRETECQELLALENSKSNLMEPLEPKLSLPAHSTVPFISNCLELRKNRQFGRHVITNRDLEVGQIIAIDEPFCTTIPKWLQYERCDNCCMEHSKSLIPCKNCTAVMFCGDKCYEEGRHRYHKYECPVIDYIYKMLPRSIDRIPLRTTLCALTNFESVDHLIEFVSSADGQDNNIFNVNFTAQFGPRERYAPIYSMEKDVDTSYSSQKIGVLQLVCEAMLKGFQLMAIIDNERHAKILMQLIEHHLLISVFSSSTILDLDCWYLMARQEYRDMRMEPNFDISDTIIGMFPFRSLLSHSCAENTLPSTHGNKLVISVQRAIKAGEQIYDSYG